MTFYVKLTLPNGAGGYLKRGALSSTDKSPYLSEFKAHCAAEKVEQELKARGMNVRATVHDWDTGAMTGAAIESAIKRAVVT